MAVETELMTPDEVLYWLDRFGIRYKVHKGAFVTNDSLMLTDHKQGLPNLKRSIEQQPDELADLAQKRTPQVCAWCHRPLSQGVRFIRCYVQAEGRRLAFHPKCYDERREKCPDLPDPEIFINEPGYTVVFEDTALCCYCQMAEAELPEDSPNVCNRCWKIRTEKNEKASAGSASIA